MTTKEKLLHGGLRFLCVGIVLYAVVAYAALPLGSLVHPDMRINFESHRLLVYTHIFASCVALLFGPWQFSSQLRAQAPRWHRLCGKLYLSIGVLAGGVAGLVMAALAYGGLGSNLGFGILAILWLYTGVRAYLAIRQGDVAAHRRWMIRNFSLTLAAVTLRIYLPVSMVMGWPFEIAYPIISWLCWLPNLLLAEYLFNRSISV